MTSFQDFLNRRLAIGGFTTEDVLSSFLPLAQQVEAGHQEGMVAPLYGIDALQVDGVRIYYDRAKAGPPVLELGKIAKVEKCLSRAVDVIVESRVTIDLNEGLEKVVDLRLGADRKAITRPVYLPGYVSWEQELGHHDPLTDIFNLGSILAALACGLNLADPQALALFVNQRGNLFELNRHLHPVIAKAVVRMTELDRHRRPQDLASLVHTLEHYREQEIDFEFELAHAKLAKSRQGDDRRSLILETLQQRLFEISRRNRLLHFRQTMQSVNLTWASVPLSFDPHSIRPDQILTWNAAFQASVIDGQAIPLNKHLCFEEALYLPGLLDHIRLEAHRDQVEFGLAQLRLVLCFLRWSNLKEKPPEPFDSPLILLPVKLVKKKGVRDTFILELETTEAEINPVVRYLFKQLYDVSLPESIDLTATAIESFYVEFANKVQSSEPGVTVGKIDRPRIQFIHAKARRRLDQYCQRTRSAGGPLQTFGEADYSYDQDNFHPLGLQLFKTRIRRPETNLQAIVRDCSRHRTFMVPESETAPLHAEKNREFYALPEPEEGNPYSWEFDLCSLTLANFRYRKMSLVHDYAALLENGSQSTIFDSIFPQEVRPINTEQVTSPALEDQFPVLSCDPTQTSAIARARTGKSCIIQGPPGTGKSQTIANLIADFVARGQRVLFVCEKRAAIDVVFHRLRQQGLQSVCSLIHDSQMDKKDFIMDLKQTYESWLQTNSKKGARPENDRKEVLQGMQRELGLLGHFYDAMRAAPDVARVPLRQLVRRLVELRSKEPELSPVELERTPAYATWYENKQVLEHVIGMLHDIQGDTVYANNPFKDLSPRLAADDHPLQNLVERMEKAVELLNKVEAECLSLGLHTGQWDTLDKAKFVTSFAVKARFLAESQRLTLLQPQSVLAKQFDEALEEFRTRTAILDKLRTQITGWKHKLPPAELNRALAQARHFENGYFNFFSLAWWRLRSTLRACYDFRFHHIRPSWIQILETLEREYQAEESLQELHHNGVMQFGVAGSFQDFAKNRHQLIETLAALPEALREMYRGLLNQADNGRMIRLAELQPKLNELDIELAGFLEDYKEKCFADLADELSLIEESLDDFTNFLPCLSEVAALPPEFLHAMRNLKIDMQGLEAAMARRSLEDIYRADRTLKRFTGQTRSRYVGQLETGFERFYAANAAVVCDRVSKRFLEHIQVSESPSIHLNVEQKDFKAAYGRGRKELEHEFGKTMRYRSIRDLVSGDSGLVIQDLKPVWLMSPLSVSDTLPLEPRHFDVVIFDEASQVTLEEAVPSLFRAGQIVVVGDQMQLPPTNFFSARYRGGEEHLQWEDEQTSTTVDYELDSNSFLAQAARTLPSTMLGWHYRSRSELLISFSNAAFYQGQLLTVPDRRLPDPVSSNLMVSAPVDAAHTVEQLLQRPLSFHFVDKAIYRQRSNPSEANYIAHLVRHLLEHETGNSIGIVAFSEAQQGEIQDALARLGHEDKSFANRLEAETEREEDGQFVGLLVKNLENIQGDERDVIILSVCYGRDPNGKMLMNFGPINQSGGEKRLNVAFSRAKKHMGVVSSIRHLDITNDYNDGARTLKNYLRYAEAVSVGDLATAHQCLRAMSKDSDEFAKSNDTDPIVSDLAGALREQGYQVDLDIGQSSFRCDLAIRREGDRTYRAAILVDTDTYYRHNDLVDQEVMRPKLLQTFGWNVIHVLTKDWYSDRERVLKSIVSVLKRKLPDDEKPLDSTEMEVRESPNADGPKPEVNVEPMSVAPVRYFEYATDNSHKFWEINVAEAHHTVRFGRIGSKGQTRTKSFANAAEAQQDALRLTHEKLAKGYVEKPPANISTE